MSICPSVRIAVVYCLHDDRYYLSESIQSFDSIANTHAFVSRIPWNSDAGDWKATSKRAKSGGATTVIGEWPDELSHRKAAIAHLVSAEFTHALIPDGDEIIEPALLESLAEIASAGLAERVYVHWDTYWKSPEYVIHPREGFTPCILIDLRTANPVGGRNFEGGRQLLLGPEYGIIHHLSYVGPDERILRKITTWGHTNEVIPGWYENTWLGWDSNPLLRDLHPTHPTAYGFAERIPMQENPRPTSQRSLALAQ